MTKYNLHNERIKKKYFGWLRDAKGFSQSTIDQAVRSVRLWEEYTKADDFRRFNTDRVINFKKALQERTNSKTKKQLSLTTLHHHLSHLSDFYQWLSLQQGYRSKISASDATYFKLDRKQTRIALNQPKKRIPTHDIIKKVVVSIGAGNEIDKRDQALMAFAFISGMRIDAIVSLPLGCVDIEKMRISQNPGVGVRTKFSKNIQTTIFNFDENLVDIVREWIKFLRKEKLFTDEGPLFPATITEQESPNSYCYVGNKLGTKFWKSTNSARDIFKRRFKESGLEYFTPHSFRHAAIKTALSLCSTPSDFKAVSQNLGHENIATTMFNYAFLPEDEVEKRIKGITNKETDQEGEIVKRLLKDYDIRPKQ